MFKSRGMTLVESLFSFSIFITVIIVIFSCYTNGLQHFQKSNNDYHEYLQLQNDKELKLWQTKSLDTSINEVLH